jgi:hypothetical protein
MVVVMVLMAKVVAGNMEVATPLDLVAVVYHLLMLTMFNIILNTTIILNSMQPLKHLRLIILIHQHLCLQLKCMLHQLLKHQSIIRVIIIGTILMVRRVVDSSGARLV